MVIEELVPEDELMDMDFLGLQGFKAEDSCREEVLCRLFLHVAFPDWHEMFHKLNSAFEAHNIG